MHDFDLFERRLAAALSSDADQGVSGFDPSTIARAAIASANPRSIRGRLATPLVFGRPNVRATYLLVVLGIILALIVGAILGGAFRTRTVRPAGWSATGTMTEARTWHSATLLPDGTVLVAGGGETDPSTSAELYDPRTGSWTATGSMGLARTDHTATLLPDGMVLVAGGGDGTGQGGTRASAELYDPSTGSWTATGSMGEARGNHTATLLSDGRVLVVGGFALASAELYDPRARTWAQTGAMHQDRGYHTATLLPDGKVLVVGGFSGVDNPQATASAELFDPDTGIWTSTADMGLARAGHTATLLPDGRVLVVGGSSGGGSFQQTASAELYDPRTASWVATGSMSVIRVYAAATLLPDGMVLVAGGYSRTDGRAPVSPVLPAELYDPSSGSWRATQRMTEARTFPTATLLETGSVLVAGGRTKPLIGSALASSELYDPGTGSR